MSADITAIILTKNEEVNIGDCIESIKKVVKRIVVIDSYSTDKTIEIAKKYGAEVYQHSFENYAKQYNYGVEVARIKTIWTLRIDADERFTPDSAKELEKIIYVFLTIFLYLLKCPQSLILSALRAFCFCGKPHISRSIFLYFLYQTWLKSW